MILHALSLLGALAPLTLLGWMVVSLLSSSDVLSRVEKMGWSLILGPTLAMLVVFLLGAAGATSFTLKGFLIPISLLLALAGWMYWKKGLHNQAHVVSPSFTAPRGMIRYGLILFLLWTAVKLIAGTSNVLTVPTYWDDSFNNWNMRGKIFYETGKPVLEIPVGNGVVQTAQGVSSYPTAVPLLKTWVSVVRGGWHEGVVNGVQLVWLSGLLFVFTGVLRRRMHLLYALTGTGILVSVPLFLIQAMNPYADVILSAHLFLVVATLMTLSSETDRIKFHALLRLFALSLGLLLFTKNEATILYAPILLLTLVYTLLRHKKGGTLPDVKKPLLTAFTILAVLALPWILFKYVNGLTFGNAKAVSGMEIRLSAKALSAIWHHLSHEPNEMLLPLLLPLAIILSGRRLLQPIFAQLSFVVIFAIGLQMILFLFIPALETEAVMQTGISRGLVQLSPIMTLLLILLTIELRKDASLSS